MARHGLCLSLFLLLPLPLSAQDKKDVDKKDSGSFTVRCSRDNAIYSTGEKATFLIASDVDGEGVFRFTDDGVKVIKQGKITVKKGETYKLSEGFPKPGFLQLAVTIDKKTKLAAAAFDPTKIEPTAVMPRDFDDFWQAGLKELATVPIDAKLEAVEKLSKDGITAYKITLANVHDKRVHGWLCVPPGKGPFPAVLTVPGAGVYGIGPDLHHARLGALAMNIIIHDMPVDQDAAFYKKMSATTLKDYRDIGMADREKSYYRDVILGCVRCLDYLTSRPDYNGKDLAVTGGSQGGALTLITSGLDPRVKFAAPNVAAMCDHSGVLHDRVSGWPHWLPRVKDKALKEKVAETAAYFDAVNFARKFKGKSLHGVGFIDTVCAPTTVYAAFNVHPEPKTMIASPLMGHGTDRRWLEARDDFWKKNMDLKPAPK